MSFILYVLPSSDNVYEFNISSSFSTNANIKSISALLTSSGASSAESASNGLAII